MQPGGMLKNASGHVFRSSVWGPDLEVRCSWGASSTNAGLLYHASTGSAHAPALLARRHLQDSGLDNILSV